MHGFLPLGPWDQLAQPRLQNPRPGNEYTASAAARCILWSVRFQTGTRARSSWDLLLTQGLPATIPGDTGIGSQPPDRTKTSKPPLLLAPLASAHRLFERLLH